MTSKRGFPWRALACSAALAIAVVGCDAVLGLAPSTLAQDVDSDGGADAARDADHPGDDASPPFNGPDGTPPMNGSEGGGGPMPSDASCGDACITFSAACPSGCTANLACERAGTPAACLDPEWAEWPAPASPGKLAADQIAESYTDNGDMTVTDNVTKLMWQQNVDTNYRTQTVAIQQCASLSLAGYHDWRLPTQIELLSIVDYTRANPCLDATYFPGTPAYAFWSSTPYTPSNAFAWGVTFDYGTEGTNTTLFPAGVRCVR
jgi:hypothetical protein